MKPPYHINNTILKLIVAISEQIGIIDANHLYKPKPELRKKNRIKTIQSSLEMEGNTLSEEQITAILENKRVLAPQKDILEVQNAITLYNQLNKYNAGKIDDLLKAHKVLMKGLISDAGKLRTQNVGIVKGNEIKHLAPGGNLVNGLLKDLFNYINNDNEVLLLKSCVFHYEFEFIHPFMDGNGRMGRFWQTLLLIKQYPVFEYLPIEHLIKKKQKLYYAKLAESDKKGHSTPFIEFMLGIINEALADIINAQNNSLTVEDRISLFKEHTGKNKFTRKDYLIFFKSISAPTASRDLKWAVEKALIIKKGNYSLTEYRFK